MKTTANKRRVFVVRLATGERFTMISREPMTETEALASLRQRFGQPVELENDQ